MNPELQGQVAFLIEAAKQTGSDVASFVREQAPDVVEQILRWKMIDNVTGLSIMLFLLIIAVWFAFFFNKLRKEHNEWTPGVIISSFISIGLVIGCLAFTSTIMKIKMAPKVVVIDYITDVVKKK